MTAIDLRGRFTLTVPEAGRLLWGLGRDASYAAAARNEIPSQKVGRRVVVPTQAALRALGWSDDLIARAIGLPEDTETAPSQDAVTATDPRVITSGAHSEHASQEPGASSNNVRPLHSR